ncbi:MAG: hypothetical protein ABL958_05310 [Bdellovibrionia bacterium]
MKNIILFGLLFTALVSQASCSKLEGYEAGNGGDESQETIFRARDAALTRLALVRQCGLTEAGQKNSRVVRFYEEHLSALIEDVKTSPYQWSKDDQDSCAWTLRSAKSPIRFSYSGCRGIAPESAETLLIHESAHHFGVDDETFATEIANAATLVNESECEPNEESIRFLNPARTFKRTAELRNVAVLSDVMCFEYSQVNWKYSKIGDPEFMSNGNYWVVAYINSKWIASAFEWIQPNVPCINLDELMGTDRNIFKTWWPEPGELVGFMISTPSRSYVPGSTDERSNIVWVRWPKTSRER